ncbi:hypothetical protein BH23ACT10_BH23ACT10_04810 [soil metagenome]
MLIRRTLPALLLMAMLAGCAQGAEETQTSTSTAPSPAAQEEQSTAAAPASAEPSAPAEQTPDADGPATVSTDKVSGYGRMLVDAEGLSLYVFFEDTDGTSTCEGACADNWPPLLTAGDPTAERKTDAGLLGVIDRADGTQQVTYDGQPLYHYSGDSAPGDVLGFALGNVWYPVAPKGEPIDVAEDRSGSGDGY